MRTNFNATVTNRNVFGLNQDRVVSLSTYSCADAAQHLALWHASKRARDLGRALKRRGLGIAAMAGAVLKAKPMCLAIMGPQWQPVRRTSPVPVIA
jgi:hypothetical protein